MNCSCHFVCLCSSASASAALAPPQHHQPQPPSVRKGELEFSGFKVVWRADSADSDAELQIGKLRKEQGVAGRAAWDEDQWYAEDDENHEGTGVLLGVLVVLMKLILSAGYTRTATFLRIWGCWMWLLCWGWELRVENWIIRKGNNPAVSECCWALGIIDSSMHNPLPMIILLWALIILILILVWDIMMY